MYHNYRLDNQLKETEKAHNIPSRWDECTREYIEAQNVFSREKGDQISNALWVSCNRRQFLLKLKAKYAGRLEINQI